MTARPGRPQEAFTAGEIGPILLERKNLKYYRAGALYMRNVEVLPQGGFRQAPGFRRVAKARKALTALSIAAATLTAPSGGTAANIRDGDTATLLTTGAISGAGPVVLLTLAFAAPAAVAAVDLDAFKGTVTGTVSVEYQSGASWVKLAGSKALKTTDRSRRFAAPPQAPVTAANWRIVAEALSGSGTVSIGEVAFWAESSDFSATRLRPFAAADGSVSDHCIAAGHVDVFSAAGWADGYAIPHGAGALPTLKTIQQLDTMLAFQIDVAPHRVLRQGSDVEWQSAPAPLMNIPLFDYGGTYGNGQPAKWEIKFFGVPDNDTADDFSFVLTVNGDDTNAIRIPLTGGGGPALPDWPAFAVVMKAALEGLPGVEPGLTVTYSVFSGQNLVEVSFTGAGNEGDEWVISCKSPDKSDVACPAYRTQRGIAPGEPIMSATRGWPRCGNFYQQRLLMGGLKSLPNNWLASWAGSFYDLDTTTAAATGAMVVPMSETEGDEAIEHIANTRSPLLLTSKGEFWLADRAISKTTAPNHVQASRHGVAPGIPVVENEGAAIFVHADRGVISEFRYNDVDQNFVTQNLTLLNSHLINGVRDQAVKRATRDNDGNQLHLVLDDGDMRIITMLREQDVTAGTRRETDGDVLACHVNGNNNVVVAAQRAVGGGAQRFIERAEQDLLLDQAVTKTLSPASATVPGLEEFEGAEVWAIADDDVLGPFTVSGATITLSQKATTVTIGRWIAPRVETLPLSREIGPNLVLERKARIHTVRLSVMDTTSIAIGANGGKIYDVPLLRFGQQMGVPALQNKFTGVVKVQGLTGYADNPTVVITQKRPGFLTVRGLTMEAAL